jgi:L-asparagine transporter-like permease
MIRSLADEGHAPSWVKDAGDIPYRGILFSGSAMLVGLGLGFMLPKQVYIFLVSSGGFAILFVYVVILATHYKLRKENGCPPQGNCQLPGYPVTSWLALASSIFIIMSMPLIPGQSAGLLAGLMLVFLFIGIYFVNKGYSKKSTYARQAVGGKSISKEELLQNLEVQFETAEELTIDQRKFQKDKEPGRKDGE